LILVTGGAGYVGSHACKLLARAGEEIVVFDNLSTGHRWAVNWGEFFLGDLRNEEDLRNCFRKYPIEAVVHFAALSLVGESQRKPEEYYLNNVYGTLNLLKVMREFKVKMIVFSSSAAVYGEPEQIPIPEEHPLRPINVYGRTKVMMEQIMADFEKTYGFRYAALRYFNAAGADPEGEIGEIHDPETHLIPNVLRTALGLQEVLEIYGTDYPTPDGSPIRDYIHVMDLAEAHLLALKHLRKGESLGPINLGTARGFSVLEIVKEAERVTGLSINRKVTGRREGDPAVLVSSNKRAFERLGWSLRFSDLETIISTAWKFLTRFQNKNG